MKPLSAEAKRRALGVGGVLVLAVVLGTAPSPAQGGTSGDSEPVAVVSAAGLQLSFAPKVADGLMLTISGPGFHTKHEFPPGASPSFLLVQENGPLEDGRYKYELRTQPLVDERIREIAAEDDDDALSRALAREEAELTMVQAGPFEIVGSSIVLTPAEVEVKAAAGVHAHGGDTHTHE